LLNRLLLGLVLFRMKGDLALSWQEILPQYFILSHMDKVVFFFHGSVEEFWYLHMFFQILFHGYDYGSLYPLPIHT
jgi:hypothetical protein